MANRSTRVLGLLLGILVTVVAGCGDNSRASESACEPSNNSSICRAARGEDVKFSIERYPSTNIKRTLRDVIRTCRQGTLEGLAATYETEATPDAIALGVAGVFGQDIRAKVRRICLTELNTKH